MARIKCAFSIRDLVSLHLILSISISTGRSPCNAKKPVENIPSERLFVLRIYRKSSSVIVGHVFMFFLSVRVSKLPAPLWGELCETSTSALEIISRTLIGPK